MEEKTTMLGSDAPASAAEDAPAAENTDVPAAENADAPVPAAQDIPADKNMDGSTTAGEPAPAAVEESVPADGSATSGGATGVEDEQAELEKAMDAALRLLPDDEPDDGGTDLSGAFSGQDKARFDARLLLIPVLALIAVGALVWALIAKGNPEGKLVINEVMTSNRTTLQDELLGTPDWVELYNGSSSDINVNGFGLSDSMKNSYRYRLPDVTIPAGGYLIVYFTGGTEAADQNPLCAGFGLSKDGDTLVLVDAHYELICQVDVPALDADAAYARREDGSYAITYVPTPNAENNTP